MRLGDLAFSPQLTNQGRETIPMDHLTIRGNQIRSISLPDNLPLDTLLTESEARKNRAPKRKGKGKGGAGRGVRVK